MQYQRMKYAHDQREWVRIADEKLPSLRNIAANLQRESADMHRAIEAGYRQNWSFNLRRQSSMEARAALFQVFYYEGMRRANLPVEGES